MYAAGLGCVWMNISAGKKLQVWLRNGVLIAIPAVTALAVVYFGYLSKGTNPSDAAGTWLVKAETFGYPLASPLLSGLSIDEMLGGLIYHTETPAISYSLAIITIIILAAGSLLLARYILRYIPNKKYILVFITFYIASTLFFSYLYLKQASVSFEGRHFRVVGMLAIPGLLFFIGKAKPARMVFAAIWVVFIGWELLYFTSGYAVNRDAAHGVSGLAQQGYDQQVLNTITGLDARQPNQAIFVLTNPDIGVEITHNRVITLDIDDMEADDLADLNYAGKAGNIYMLMPEVYVKNGIAAKVAKSFRAYKQFSVKQLNKNFYLYAASN
jgi:hypothetical protein